MPDELVARRAEALQALGIAIHIAAVVEQENGIIGYVKQRVKLGLAFLQRLLHSMLLRDVADVALDHVFLTGLINIADKFNIDMTAILRF